MKLGRRERILFAVLGIMLASAGGYLAASWYVKTLGSLRAELQTATSDLRRVEEKVRDLEAIRQRLTEARKLQEDYRRLVPNSEEVPQLLRDTYTILTKSGVHLSSFTPGGPTPVAPVPELNQLTVVVTATGAYREILAMFDTLRSWRRLIGIKDFTLTRWGEKGENLSDPTLSCQFNMIVFFANIQAAAAGAEPSGP